MKTHDFYYDLPEELIAQTPLEKRDTSRLMTLDRVTGAVDHKHFYDIIDYLDPGDCLVMNDSRVLPARLLGHRPTGGAVEVLLLRDLGDKRWQGHFAQPLQHLQEDSLVMELHHPVAGVLARRRRGGGAAAAGSGGQALGVLVQARKEDAGGQ